MKLPWGFTSERTTVARLVLRPNISGGTTGNSKEPIRLKGKGWCWALALGKDGKGRRPAHALASGFAEDGVKELPPPPPPSLLPPLPPLRGARGLSMAKSVEGLPHASHVSPNECSKSARESKKGSGVWLKPAGS